MDDGDACLALRLGIGCRRLTRRPARDGFAGMIDHDETYMRIALDMAQAAARAEEAPIGAVIVDPAATVAEPETPTPAAAAEPAVAERVPFTVVPRSSDDELFAEPEEPTPSPSDDEPAHATSSFDAAIEPLRNRMTRAKLDPSFVRDLLVSDAVLDVGETAMRWAGMPNKHERALTSEVFFALAEWGFLAPRADGRYRVIKVPDEAKV